MKAKSSIALTAFSVLVLLLGARIPCQAGLLEDLGFPAYPGSKLVTEINLPAGKLLDSITQEFGPMLGLSDVKQAGVVTYHIDTSADSQRVFKYYESSTSTQGWKTLVQSFENNNGTVILYHEGKGLLILSIDPPTQDDRQFTMVRVIGTIDMNKLADKDRKLSSRIKQWVDGRFGPEGNSGQIQSVSKIPVSQPIAVPPAQWIHLKATGSDITARLADQNTAEIRVASRKDDIGELVRTSTGLILSLAPGVQTQAVVLPSSVLSILQLTEGSLVLQGGKASKLSISSTSAPVTLDSIALVSGTQTIKVVGADVKLAFSQIQGGTLDVDVTSGNLTLVLPRNASARIEIAAPASSIQNQTGIQPQKSVSDHMSLQTGAGSAVIRLQATKGTVCVRFAD